MKKRLESDALVKLRELLQGESSDSRALIEDPVNNPICSVSFDESVPCVLVYWKRYATSGELRFIHEHILNLLETHEISKILCDDTALPTVHAEDQTWIVENWMPRAKAAGLRVVASKKSSSYFGKLAIKNIQSAAPADLVIHSFDDLSHARQWLRNF